MTVDGDELETVARKSGELKGPKSRSARRFDDGLSIVGDKICFSVARERKKMKNGREETQILTFGAIHVTSGAVGSSVALDR